MSERLIKAAEAIKADVCGLLCPSQWETAKGRPPHHPKCVELQAALTASQDDPAYNALHDAREFIATHPTIPDGKGWYQNKVLAQIDAALSAVPASPRAEGEK